MGFTAHYVTYDEEEKKPNLLAPLLRLKGMDADETKTADVLHDHIVATLHEFDLQDQTEKIVFISDRGKNIVNSCDGYARNSCLDHFVNNVVCETVKEIDAIRVNVIKVCSIFAIVWNYFNSVQ